MVVIAAPGCFPILANTGRIRLRNGYAAGTKREIANRSLGLRSAFVESGRSSAPAWVERIDEFSGFPERITSANSRLAGSNRETRGARRGGLG